MNMTTGDGIEEFTRQEKAFMEKSPKRDARVPVEPVKMQSVTISKVENGYAVSHTSPFGESFPGSKLWVAETKEKLLDVLGVILE
jgi:hypothetical protein